MKKFIYIVFIISIITLNNLWSEEWEVISEMPVPVKGAQAVVHNSLIYVIGGYSDSTFSPINKIQIFNPEDTSWVVIEDTLAIGRYGHVVVNDNDKALIFGGGASEDSLNRSLESWDFITSPTVISFNPVFNRQFATAQIYGNMLYIFGGYSTEIVEDSTGMDYLAVYDISDRSFVYSDAKDFAAENIPIHQMSAKLQNNIFIFGGVSWGLSRSIYVYNTIGNTFTELGTFLIDARAGGSAVVLDESRIALIGGYNEENQPMASVEVLETFDNFIHNQTNIEPLNYARSEPTVVLYDSFVYVFGGRDSFDKCIPYVEKSYIEVINHTLLQGSDKIYLKNDYELYQNYPNPFNPSTTIMFKNSKAMHVKLNVFSIDGSHVKSLINAYIYPGNHQFIWDGRDEHNKLVSSGVYFYKIDNGIITETKRMILMR